VTFRLNWHAEIKGPDPITGTDLGLFVGPVWSGAQKQFEGYTAWVGRIRKPARLKIGMCQTLHASQKADAHLNWSHRPIRGEPLRPLSQPDPQITSGRCWQTDWKAESAL
jgi:hypothetical protein